ncbi:hypothetical protein [Planctomicrobium piriforme]|uniref:PriA DNA helicase Cys-rich region (CRR) domain-containing protein n=1 Tax=Planctomicrobium piriforme TaxID=1576369 RepID=A0A1I3B4C6_9PLAN|nr:hypothetical protein [Planctomicrobium piriforme]SFH56809.1 hypothetical protein SAMN05421753_101209 [Planctomicrobium piriforme]
MSTTDSPSDSGEVIDGNRGRIFPCPECGADLVFHVGKQQLKCTHCGAEKVIALDATAAVQEQDFQQMLEQLEKRKKVKLPPHPQPLSPPNSFHGRGEGSLKIASEEASEHSEVRCESCGANVIFAGTLTSTSCPYCGSPIQREKVHRGGFRVPVDAVLPFQVEQRRAEQLLTTWIQSRWFAPNDYKRAAEHDHFHGVYLPFWTFDSLTFTKYSGERGDHYHVTVGSGKDERREQRTRWQAAAGQFQRFFDDVLIHAAKELPVDRIDALAPWPLQKCQPFTPEYLAGFFARTYDIDLGEGFKIARQRMNDELRSDCLQRIGGDEQRLHEMKARFDAVTFKHLLLPVWILAYRYRGESYRVFINAVTGEAQGDRPYSWIKITLTVLAVLAVAATIFIVFQR